MLADKPLLVYFGHHKCASTWIHQIVANACVHLNLRYRAVYNSQAFDHDLPRFVRENQIQFLTYGNADYQHARQLGDLIGFHVVRDPRDLLVSAYFSHLYSHPTENWPALAEHRPALQALPQDEGLLLDMQFNRRFLDEMYSWDYAAPNVLQLRMEEFVKEPEANFRRIFSAMGLLPENIQDQARLLVNKILRRGLQWAGSQKVLYDSILSDKALKEILSSQDFKKKTGGREAGQEDKKSHYRKGVSGDWVNHMKVVHLKYFVEHYNPVLLKLGYESDPNWAEAYLRKLEASEPA